jgi:hypothetical protein
VQGGIQVDRSCSRGGEAGGEASGEGGEGKFGEPSAGEPRYTEESCGFRMWRGGFEGRWRCDDDGGDYPRSFRSSSTSQTFVGDGRRQTASYSRYCSRFSPASSRFPPAFPPVFLHELSTIVVFSCLAMYSAAPLLMREAPAQLPPTSSAEPSTPPRSGCTTAHVYLLTNPPRPPSCHGRILRIRVEPIVDALVT